MKTNDWYFLSLLGLYSGLFYKQVPGLNLLIFTLAFVIIMTLMHRERFNRKLLLAAILCTLSASAVFIHGNLLSFLASITSIGVFSFLCFSRKNSVFASLLFSAYNLLFSMFWVFVDSDKRMGKLDKVTEKKFTRTLGFILIPLIICLLFVLLYRNANPVFKDLTNQIDLSFISMKFIGFTILGGIIIYGIFSPKGIDKWHIYESLIPNKALKKDRWDQYISSESEYKLAIWVIALLNLLLLSVNMIDLSYLVFGQNLPTNLTLSELLHQGVNTLIFSIILAIAVVLVFFRGRLNYYKNNRSLKILTIIWLGLNLCMALLTMEKNHLYISEYGLTYKRIGVYVYLLLTCFGLIYTMVKVQKIRSNWFLVRRLGWYFWGTLIISAFVPWNAIIAKVNIEKYVSEDKDIDLAYLYELGPETYPIIYDNQKVLMASKDSELFKTMDRKAAYFIAETASKSWRSYNMSDDLLSAELKKNLD